MSHNHRDVSRSALTHHVTADLRAVKARRNTMDTHPDWSWITEHDKTVAACFAILQGKPNLYPIFGIQLHVESRTSGGETFPILIYTDAEDGDEGQNLRGKIPPGYWVGVSKLFCNPEKMFFKKVEDGLLVLTMLAQSEMQEALAMYFEKEAQERQAQEKAQRELLNTLRSRVLPSITAPVAVDAKKAETSKPVSKKVNAKPDYPVFTKLSDILGNSIGVFNHPSGVTIKVCSSGGGFLVSASTRDEAHPAFACSSKNQLLRQMDVIKEEFIPYEGEKCVAEKQIFMDWLRKQLKNEKTGKASPVAVATEVIAVSQQLMEVATTPVVPSATVSVDEILGAATTNGVTKGKPGVPAKRTKPRTKKTACEAVTA